MSLLTRRKAVAFSLAAAVLLVAALAIASQVAGQDPPPAADAGADQRVECASSEGSPVRLDADGTRLPANATNVSHAWYEDYNASSQRLVGEGPEVNATFPLGRHDVTLVVTMDVETTDEGGTVNATSLTLTDAAVVEVVDTTPPTLTAAPSEASLWPPNHKLVPVTVEVHAWDACTPDPAWVLASAASDEAADGRGDGRTSPDLLGADVGTPDTAFQLRSERAGPGDGRAYTLTYEARDASGNVARADALVSVPHDQGET